MADEEKQYYIDYCKYDKEPKEVILNLMMVQKKII